MATIPKTAVTSSRPYPSRAHYSDPDGSITEQGLLVKECLQSCNWTRAVSEEGPPDCKLPLKAHLEFRIQNNFVLSQRLYSSEIIRCTNSKPLHLGGIHSEFVSPYLEPDSPIEFLNLNQKFYVTIYSAERWILIIPNPMPIIFLNGEKKEALRKQTSLGMSLWPVQLCLLKEREHQDSIEVLPTSIPQRQIKVPFYPTYCA